MKNLISKFINKLDWKWISIFYLINCISCVVLAAITHDIGVILVWFSILTFFSVCAVIDEIYTFFIKEPHIVKVIPINKKIDYKLSHEEGVEIFNQLQVGKEYEVLDLVTGEWKKQIYQPPNEQEAYEKMIHGIRYGWIRIYKTDLYGGYFN